MGPMSAADQFAPSLDDFHALALAAWAALPAPLRAAAGEVVFRIEDFAEDELLDDLGIEDAFELTGLYRGVDLTRASISDPTPHQPMVFLYRRPILDEWAARGDVGLAELISHVLVHEMGHHFGLSDEAIDALLEAAD
jgi:predicted Zn-dependent protease with MMP-like domain